MNVLVRLHSSDTAECATRDSFLTFYHPDSPGAGRRHLAKKNSVVEGLIDPERDIYAIPAQVGMKFNV